MDQEKSIYICPVCFQVCETMRECHEHEMIECKPGRPGSERRKPLTDQYGNIVSRAPRWYLEATGMIPAWSPRQPIQ